ncbi:DNA cytosine methyltransferase [Novosphingobium aquimarinum]|uniref:DNA cytosine methyltransferase n=1 Tax=Novosphingobium aquimarinum TaxID=2682494 RepID=UPI0018DC56F3|nr:DNA cytosine methyltransferase [Novosphingobium aquimarinum]
MKGRLQLGSGFKVVDVFAGPGGLAEGFSSFIANDGSSPFDIALSVEKEKSAFATLRLRAFSRQFATLPSEYYRFLAGNTSRDALVAAYPKQWQAAADETRMLELGSDEARAELDPILDLLKSEGETVLIGGPPCQAYSLVGRARNRGNSEYVASEDHRHFLYKEYIRIIERLEPAAFVMENVKGMLSATVDGESMIDRIIADLRSIGGETDRYRLIPLVSHPDGGLRGNIIYAEKFGIPQKRHRVILMGVRADAVDGIDNFPRLEPVSRTVTVADVLGGMERLRSGLSRGGDDGDRWQAHVATAFSEAADALEGQSEMGEVQNRLIGYRDEILSVDKVMGRKGTQATPIASNVIAAWLQDGNLEGLPNHETRGHMPSDLARYAFVATFAEVTGRTPKAKDFPPALAPDHKSWNSGKFADRFRVQLWEHPSTTITSHISKDGHYFIHPDPAQCRSLTVREAARLQTFPDNYFFEGNRTQQYVQVGNAVPPLLARQIAAVLWQVLDDCALGRAETAKARVAAQ